MTLKQQVKQMQDDWPTLYGKSDLRAYNQLFFVNGNGYRWRNGRPRHDGPREPRTPRNTGKLWRWCWDFLAGADALETNPAGPDWFFALCKQGHSPKDALSLAAMLKDLVKPARYYVVSLETYSMVAEVPDNAAEDCLLAIRALLTYAIFRPEQATDPARGANNAIIHWLRLARRHPRIFCKFASLDALISRNNRELDSIKNACPLLCLANGSAVYDCALLDNKDFFRLHALDCSNLDNRQMDLVRKLKVAVDKAAVRSGAGIAGGRMCR